MRFEYLKTKKITATLETKTGLHIGAGRDSVEIGGVDNPVIRHPHTQQPYIPGSSLKGKLRSLLEWALGSVDPNGEVWGSNRRMVPLSDDPILRIFGTTHEKWEGGPTRLIVRDAHLEKAWVDGVLGRSLPMTEDKTEVSIDRIQGKAKDGGLHTVERVPSGARFALEMAFKVYSVTDSEGRTDNGSGDTECLNRVLEALKLLEADALGGSGSRGSGQVRITDLRVDGTDIQASFDALKFSRNTAGKIVE